MYNEYYSGNVIFYDPDVTAEARRAVLSIENNALTYSYDVAMEDKYFDDVPERYKALIPEVRYNDIRQGIVDEISNLRSNFFNSVTSIENAIVDYCDGDGVVSEENSTVLNFYLSKNNPSPTPSPNSGPNSGPSLDSNNSFNEDGLEDELKELGVDSSEIYESLGEDYYDIDVSDEEIVMSQVDDIADKMGDVIIPFLGNEVVGEISSGIDFNGIETSLSSASNDLGFGNSAVLPMTLVSESNDNDNSELLKASSISAAAMAALSGKIMYDKRKENSTNADVVEDVLNQDEDFNNNSISGTNFVELKKALLNDTEVMS